MKKKKVVNDYEPYTCPCCGTGMGEEHGDVMCNTCGFLCAVGLYHEIMANRAIVKELKDKENKQITIGEFHDLLDNKKTDPYILFDEMMEYIVETQSLPKYKKLLKKIGEWVDVARVGYGLKSKAIMFMK